MAGVNTSVSALAVIHKFNPTLWRLRAAQRAETRSRVLPDDHDSRVRELVAIADRYAQIEADLVDRRLFLPDVRRVRFGIFHNPDAEVPLPRTFAGVHDEQWDELATSDGAVAYCPVAFGRDAQEWQRLDD